jgi:hypothetical protein
MAIVLVCACGKRLKAAGATPGRLGRCPACGGLLRVAGPETSATPAASPRRPDPPPDSRAEDMPAGYGVLPATVVPPPTFVAARPAPRAGPTGTGPGHAMGWVRPPDAPETRIGESLLYPVWDGPGIFVLFLMPPVLTAMVLVVFGLVVPMVIEGGPMLLAVAVASPLLLGFAAVLGSLCQILGQILTSSAWGEVYHPRWPRTDVFGKMVALGRWLGASLVGWVVGGLPALLYWIRCGDLDLFDRILLAELLALGASYAQMALVAVLLHEDLRAANPITVVRAIRAIGWPYARPCLLVVAAVLLAGAAATAVARLPHPGLQFLGLWAVCTFVLYEAMVQLRVLGLCYYRHAARLGWFPERPRWRVRG